MSRTPPVAVNAELRPVTVYAPDPHGASMVFGLTSRINSTLNGARAVVEASPTWYGWTQAPQQMRGQAGLGAARPYAPRNSEISKETTTTAPTAAAIFESRMLRGRS